MEPFYYQITHMKYIVTAVVHWIEITHTRHFIHNSNNVQITAKPFNTATHDGWYKRLCTPARLPAKNQAVTESRHRYLGRLIHRVMERKQKITSHYFNLNKRLCPRVKKDARQRNSCPGISRTTEISFSLKLRLLGLLLSVARVSGQFVGRFPSQVLYEIIDLTASLYHQTQLDT